MVKIFKDKAERNELIILFVVAFSFWFIDFFTTFLSLKFHSDYINEANPIAAYFFSLGPIGFVIDFFFVLALITFVLVLLPIIYSYLFCKPLDNLIYRLKKSKKKKKKKDKYYRDYVRFIRIFTAGMIVGQEAIVLIHNWLIIKPHLAGLA
jgi:hypothetical protein